MLVALLRDIKNIKHAFSQTSAHLTFVITIEITISTCDYKILITIKIKVLISITIK